MQPQNLNWSRFRERLARKWCKGTQRTLPKICVEALGNQQDGRVQNPVPGEDGEGGGQRAGGRHRHPHLPHGRPHDHLPLRQVRMVPRALQEQHGEPGLHQSRLQGQHSTRSSDLVQQSKYTMTISTPRE